MRRHINGIRQSSKTSSIGDYASSFEVCRFQFCFRNFVNMLFIFHFPTDSFSHIFSTIFTIRNYYYKKTILRYCRKCHKINDPSNATEIEDLKIESKNGHGGLKNGQKLKTTDYVFAFRVLSELACPTLPNSNTFANRGGSSNFHSGQKSEPTYDAQFSSYTFCVHCTHVPVFQELNCCWPAFKTIRPSFSL